MAIYFRLPMLAELCSMNDPKLEVWDCSLIDKRGCVKSREELFISDIRGSYDLRDLNTSSIYEAKEQRAVHIVAEVETAPKDRAPQPRTHRTAPGDGLPAGPSQLKPALQFQLKLAPPKAQSRYPTRRPRNVVTDDVVTAKRKRYASSSN